MKNQQSVSHAGCYFVSPVLSVADPEVCVCVKGGPWHTLSVQSVVDPEVCVCVCLW